jgi:hypothetical protein
MISLITLIQKNLGYQELQKIDPNTQEIKIETSQIGNQSLIQAAVPAVICGLCDCLKSDEGADMILHTESTNWLDSIFGKNKEELTRRISTYSKVPAEGVTQETSHIANEAVRLTREHIGHSNSADSIRLFAKEQQGDAQLYLPAAIQLGDLLKDNQLDDRAHKMEGPISSLMHSFEKQF